MNFDDSRPAGPAAVVALKSLDLAKSRFTGHDPAVRRRLALCMLADTVAALGRAVTRVAVVTSTPAMAAMVGVPDLEVVADPGDGLNAAFEAGAQRLRRQGFSPVLAAVGDLPGLHPRAVREIVDRCRPPGRYFVRDHHGSGTTMLISHGRLDPLFENGSARRHLNSGANEIDAARWPGARTDVDSEDDLDLAARTLELGPRTSAMLDGTRLADHDVATICATEREGNKPAWRAILAQGHRITIPGNVLDALVDHLAIGQRVHIQRSGMRVLSAWI